MGGGSEETCGRSSGAHTSSKNPRQFHGYKHTSLSFFFVTFYELRLDGVLRRLMSNCERRGRSRGSMLVPNLLPKAVPHDGPRLLPYLIVRLHRRVVEGLPPPERASQARPSGSAFRERGPYPGHHRPVASLQKRARLLEIRFF